MAASPLTLATAVAIVRLMHAIRRHALRVFSFLSLLLAIVVLVLWAVSYRRAYVIGLGVNRFPERDLWQQRVVNARLVKGHWMLRWEHLDTQLSAAYFADWDADYVEAFRRDPPAFFEHSFESEEVLAMTGTVPGGGTRAALDPLLDVPQFIGFGRRHMPMGVRGQAGAVGSFDFVSVPAWFSVIVLLVPPAVGFARSRTTRRRRKAGRCVGCGYDLRASTDRCPECGAPRVVTA